MLEIKDKHISMTRGDTGFFNIRIIYPQIKRRLLLMVSILRML